MSFTDPESIDIGAGTVSLPRVSVGKNESIYSSGDGSIVLKASSQYGKRTRRTIRLDLIKTTTDPYIPAQNVKVSASMYIVFDLPPAGYTPKEMEEAFEGYSTLLNASSAVLITKLLGGES